jgi:hypothetical protein
MAPREEQLRKIIDCIFVAHQESAMDCEACNRELDCLAEKVAGGASFPQMRQQKEAKASCSNGALSPLPG